jgi:hypothetical protein
MGQLSSILVAAHRVDQDEPGGVAGMRVGEQPHKDLTIRMPNQHVGWRDAAWSSRRPRSAISVAASCTPLIAGLLTSPARS